MGRQDKKEYLRSSIPCADVANMKSDALKNRKGQALVETALVLFFIVIITFGITEFGRAMYIKNMLNNAARAAVRQAVVTGSLYYSSPAFPTGTFASRPTDPIGAKIYDSIMYISASEMQNYVFADVFCTPACTNASSPASSGSTVTVTVTYSNFKPFVNIIKISSTLAGQASMRYE
jgi:Flp pilus assembly protein TadG